MAYIKTTWVDRLVERPNTFDVQENPDGSITLIPKPGVVTEAGTPVNAGNLNNIEDGIEGIDGAIEEARESDVKEKTFDTLKERLEESEGEHQTHLAESSTKHITESGSNENGRYIKFDDGTMICYARVDVDFNIVGFHDFNTPHTFMAVYAGSFTARDVSFANASEVDVFSKSILRTKNTEWNLYVRESINKIVPVGLFAIGKWK